MSSADQAALAVIEAVKGFHDYSSQQDAISEYFSTWLWDGNWYGTLDFADGHPALAFWQEDEYDQHRGAGAPEWDNQLAFVSGHYVFPG